MRKVTWSVALALTLIAVTPAAAQVAGLDISTPYPGLMVEPGDTASFNLTLTADTRQEVALSTPTVPEGWTATFRGSGNTIASVTVGPDLAPEVRLDVIVPVEAEEGDYTVGISGAGTAGTASLDLTITVRGGAGGQVTMTPDAPGLRGTADATYTFNVEVRNDTPAEVQLELAAEGPPGWQVDARPSGQAQAASIAVEAGATGRITVTADPPVDVEAGDYDLRVTAEGSGYTSEAPLLVRIEGNFAMDLTTADQRLNAEVTVGQPSELPLVVINTGSAPLQGVTLSATPPRGWEVTFSPEAINSIPAGEAASVIATITPASDALAGDYQITFRASIAETQDSVEVRATVSPSAVLGLVGVGLIALTLAALAWVFRRFGRR
jgi:uncharacterized membrane protein